MKRTLIALIVVASLSCAARAGEPDPAPSVDGLSLGRCLPPILAPDDMDREWYVVRCESGAVIFIPREVIDQPSEPAERPRAPKSNT